MREGIILRLVDEAGNVGWGEIAPIPWFGSETIEQALEFCYQQPSKLSQMLIFSIPDMLPSCQFAFESAWEGMRKQLIGNLKTPTHRDTTKQASLATQNSSLQAENLTLRLLHASLQSRSAELQPRSLDNQAQNSDVSAQSSILRPQNSAISAQNSHVEAQSSECRPQNSILRPQNSDVEAQNSECRPQNSGAEAQSSEHQVQNSHVEAQSSEYRPQNSHHDQTTVYSALLPAGKPALCYWKPLWEQGFHTFKWKIGVYPIALELEFLHVLAQTLPKTATLRLDANGGLSIDDALRWLHTCDAMTADPNRFVKIEYIEQPLPPAQFQAMQHLSQHYRTSIALDESVATLYQLQTCYKNGWRGIVVIKPTIVGSPFRLRQFCQTHAIDAVFSSAFETAIGRQAGLTLAMELANPNRALGYGTTHWFDDAENNASEQLWQTL